MGGWNLVSVFVLLLLLLFEGDFGLLLVVDSLLEEDSRGELGEEYAGDEGSDNSFSLWILLLPLLLFSPDEDDIDPSVGSCCNFVVNTGTVVLGKQKSAFSNPFSFIYPIAPNKVVIEVKLERGSRAQRDSV